MIYLVRANSLIISNDWISSFEVIEPFCENPFVFEINHKLNVWRKNDRNYPPIGNTDITALRTTGYVLLYVFTIEDTHLLVDSEHDNMKPLIRNWKLKELDKI